MFASLPFITTYISEEASFSNLINTLVCVTRCYGTYRQTTDDYLYSHLIIFALCIKVEIHLCIYKY